MTHDREQDTRVPEGASPGDAEPRLAPEALKDLDPDEEAAGDVQGGYGIKDPGPVSHGC